MVLPPPTRTLNLILKMTTHSSVTLCTGSLLSFRTVFVGLIPRRDVVIVSKSSNTLIHFYTVSRIKVQLLHHRHGEYKIHCLS